MKNWTISLLMAICFGNLNAQKVDSVFQYIGHRIFNGVQSKQITKFDYLPEKIQVVTLDFIKKRFDDYSLKIKFIDAQISPIDSFFIEDIEALKENNTIIHPIPYYDLYFSFKDVNLGISQYAIRIGIDKFGQVIECNFPLMSSGRKINSLMVAKEYSDSLLTVMYPKINKENPKISLEYSKENDILKWEFCYLISTTLNQRDYLCLILNAHDKSLIKQEWMGEILNSDNNCNCEVIQQKPEYRDK
jgi:hypothetical protein